ncbi:hypothetical protein [Longimicrobium sp.]|uniref:hypothetical protein n=1 Tax=Longimicrobium sp. TaxID=2029185 RepID=UPI002E303CA6|nr:hypothetical protein [Longimicrobium sp.]HEX6042201.1 hypothetical protein [Longimicrobium sp.]
MSIRMTVNWMRALWCGMLLAGPHGAAAQATPASVDRDAAIFQAVITELAGSSEGVLLVDPRTLDSRADLTSVDPEDVGEVSRAREDVLEGMGIRTTAFLADKPCMFASGLPPAPEFDTATEEQRTVRQQCRARGPFTSVIVGGARPDGDTVAVNVARLTPSRYAARRFILQRCARETWMIIRVEELIGIRS